MGKFKVTLTDLAKKQLRQHEKAGHQATLNRINVLFMELAEHGAGYNTHIVAQIDPIARLGIHF